jgi:tripartite-type tricarboxylate transporter receptor subunit TctC
MYVGNPPGGGYDSYARVTARHLTRFIPGHPAFVVQNMPGAGGLRVTGHMYNVAPKDGTAIALTQRAILTAPLLESGDKPVHFDVLKFNWIGSINVDTGYIIAWHTSLHKRMEDLFSDELIVGSSNPSSETIPYFLNNVFGTKLKIVSGYKSGTEILLAMERGEVQARILGSISGLETLLEPWIRENKVRFLAVVSPRRSRLMPELPILHDFAKDEKQTQMLDLILASQLWGRPYLMPPGVPQDRVTAVREAFNRMTADRAFLEETRKLGLDVELVRGDEIDVMLKKLYALPADVVRETRKAVTPH